MVVAAVVVSIFLGIIIGEQDYKLASGVLGVSALALSVMFPQVISFLAVSCYSSGLTLPQLEGRLNFFYVFSLILLGVAALKASLNQKSLKAISQAHIWLLAFCAVLILTILVRGAGLRVLGDVKWGGMFYIQLFIGISLIFSLAQINMAPRFWRVALVTSAILSFLPFLATFLASFGMNVLLVFVQGDSQTMAQLDTLNTGLGNVFERYFSLGVAGQALFVIPFYFLSVKNALGKSFPKVFIVGLFSILLVGFSGFRSSIINIFLFTIILVYISNSLTIGRVFLLIFLTLNFYVFAFIFAKSMPDQFQRMVSFIPGVEVEFHARHDAVSTIDWRMELWGRGIQSIPKYWLIGKGYAFDSSEALAAADQTTGFHDSTEWAVVQNSYHQGILSLLVGLGLPGLVAGLGAYIAFARRHWFYTKVEWHSAPLHLCHSVFTAQLLSSLIFFVFFYGDVQVSFPQVFFNIAVLEGLWGANMSLKKSVKT